MICNLVLLLILTSCAFTNTIEKILSVTNEDGEFTFHDSIVSDWIAKANFTDNTFIDGWSYLEVETNESYSNIIQSYAAGMVEGAASHTIIYNYWRNTMEGFCSWKGQKYCDNLLQFLKQNVAWMKEMIMDLQMTSDYWHNIELVLSQLKGLATGYNKVADEDKQITLIDILLINLSGDLEDLDSVIDSHQMESQERRKNWIKDKILKEDGRCSALIKSLVNNKDLYVSHVTWNTYQSMLRVQKKYILPMHYKVLQSGLLPGHISVFSSYPAMIHSGDDFYVMASGLVTMETTIGNSNPNLWVNVTPDGELQEWIRAIVANRLSTTGSQWCTTFEQYNSGTYNNQWMVVDYKRFKPGKDIRLGTLWVLEQLPGLIKFADQSGLLKKQSYWPSYNTPFYPEIFNMSGAPKLVARYGDWFTYDKTPRALIFKRDHDKVHDLESMIKLMRYNDYKNDPLSACNCTPPYSAENAISARCDLNPANGTYPFGALGHRSHGATDVKLVNLDLVLKLRFMAVGGPTNDQQPTFKWSEQDFANDTPHYGQPDAWHFGPVLHKWIW